MAMYNIQELAEQIVETKTQIETEIKVITSARENLENIQGMAQTLADGFQSLQKSMKSYLDQNNALIRDASREQLNTIEEKFGESFAQLETTQKQITGFVENNSEMIAAVNKLNEELPQLQLANKLSELAGNFHNQVQELHGALNVIETANRENAKKLTSLTQDSQKQAGLLQKEIRAVATASEQDTRDITQEFKKLHTAVGKQADFTKLELTIVSRNNDKLLENQRGLNSTLSVFFDTSNKEMGKISSFTKISFGVLLLLNGITILLLLLR